MRNFLQVVTKYGRKMLYAETLNVISLSRLSWRSGVEDELLPSHKRSPVQWVEGRADWTVIINGGGTWSEAASTTWASGKRSML